jgi:glycosyltransferase involved in cell wall biosynthesis
LLENDITILHWSTIMAMHSWYKEKKWLYTAYYFIISLNTLLTYFVASKIYTVSEFTKWYISKFNKNVEVCWLWVDQNFWKFKKWFKKEDYWYYNDDFLLIFVWRFDIWKWSDKLIEIMKNNKNNKIKLLACVSKIPENYSEYEKIWIKFFENLWKEDLIKLYSISDTFIFPTRYEWYWFVLAEALSIWLPAITTNIALWNMLKIIWENNPVVKERIKVLESNDNYKFFLGAIEENYKLFSDWKLKKQRLDLDCLDLDKSISNWKKII